MICRCRFTDRVHAQKDKKKIENEKRNRQNTRVMIGQGTSSSIPQGCNSNHRILRLFDYRASCGFAIACVDNGHTRPCREPHRSALIKRVHQVRGYKHLCSSTGTLASRASLATSPLYLQGSNNTFEVPERYSHTRIVFLRHPRGQSSWHPSRWG